MNKEYKEALKRIVAELRTIGDNVADEARENASNNSGDVYDGAAEATRIYIAATLIEEC